jgi:hypothetical protein
MSDDCPHYDLIPDPVHPSLSVCNACGAVIRVQISGLPVEDFYDQGTTVVAKEGDDVAFNWPGEG